MATRINSDFKELVSVFSSERVRYLVVVGVAVIEHTEPRYTKDLDVWVEPTKENAQRVYRALVRFGAPLRGITAKDFENERIVFQMGVEPVRIDVLMSLEGVSFDEAWRARTRVRWGRTAVNVLSVDHLIANRRRVARPQDLVDVAALKALRRKTARRGR